MFKNLRANLRELFRLCMMSYYEGKIEYLKNNVPYEIEKSRAKLAKYAHQFVGTIPGSVNDPEPMVHIVPAYYTDDEPDYVTGPLPDHPDEEPDLETATYL